MYKDINFIFDRTQKDVDLAYEEIKLRGTKKYNPTSKVFYKREDLERLYEALNIMYEDLKEYGYIVFEPTVITSDIIFKLSTFENYNSCLNKINLIFANSKVRTEHNNITNFLHFKNLNLLEEYTYLLYSVSFYNLITFTNRANNTFSGKVFKLPIKV